MAVRKKKTIGINVLKHETMQLQTTNNTTENKTEYKPLTKYIPKARNSSGKKLNSKTWKQKTCAP
jgi:hypothetical protein